MDTDAQKHDPQPCRLLATLFAGLLAQALSAACGSEWSIELVDPPSPSLPTLPAPVLYRLTFGQGLAGGCYLAIDETTVAIFTRSGSTATAQESEAPAEPAQAEELLLALLTSALKPMPDSLAPAHGAVTIEAVRCPELDPKAESALEFRAHNASGESALLLLHFDPELLASLAIRSAGASPSSQANLGMVMDVELNCTLRFGQRQLSLREILDLASGSVVELDREVDEPVDLILDGKVIARGEAVIIDGNYGLRVTQVVHQVTY